MRGVADTRQMSLDGQTDGRKGRVDTQPDRENGWTYDRTDERTDGRMDGRTILVSKSEKAKTEATVSLDSKQGAKLFLLLS